MNMEIIGPLGLSLIAGLSTVIGCIFIFLKVKKTKEFITFSLSFSFTIMVLLSIFDLLPNSLNTIITSYGIVFGLILSVLIFILGNLTIRVINQKIKAKKESKLYRVGVLSMFSLFAHNLPEGIAVFMSAYADIRLGISLCIAIMLHNIPEGIVISVPLYHSGIKRYKVVLYTLLSGLSEPLGALLCYIFLKNIITDNLLSFVLIFVAGLMINLSLNDILKESLSYKKPKYLIMGVLTGILTFIITSHL